MIEDLKKWIRACYGFYDFENFHHGSHELTDCSQLLLVNARLKVE